jgi:hypothetical protein
VCVCVRVSVCMDICLYELVCVCVCVYVEVCHKESDNCEKLLIILCVRLEITNWGFSAHCSC